MSTVLVGFTCKNLFYIGHHKFCLFHIHRVYTPKWCTNLVGTNVAFMCITQNFLLCMNLKKNLIPDR